MTQDRWNIFTKSQQLLMIGSEIMRAKVWQKENPLLFKEALERAFSLLDFSLEDPKWNKSRYSLLVLREELGKFYIGARVDNIDSLYQIL